MARGFEMPNNTRPRFLSTRILLSLALTLTVCKLTSVYSAIHLAESPESLRLTMDKIAIVGSPILC